MAKKKYYYTIWSGLQTGVFDEWDGCKDFVLGVSYAQYEKFATYEEAQEALSMGYKVYRKKKKEYSDFINQPLF